MAAENVVDEVVPVRVLRRPRRHLAVELGPALRRCAARLTAAAKVGVFFVVVVHRGGNGGIRVAVLRLRHFHCLVILNIGLNMIRCG